MILLSEILGLMTPGSLIKGSTEGFVAGEVFAEDHQFVEMFNEALAGLCKDAGENGVQGLKTQVLGELKEFLTNLSKEQSNGDLTLEGYLNELFKALNSFSNPLDEPVEGSSPEPQMDSLQSLEKEAKIKDNTAESKGREDGQGFLFGIIDLIEKNFTDPLNKVVFLKESQLKPNEYYIKTGPIGLNKEINADDQIKLEFFKEDGKKIPSENHFLQSDLSPHNKKISELTESLKRIIDFLKSSPSEFEEFQTKEIVQQTLRQIDVSNKAPMVESQSTAGGKDVKGMPYSAVSEDLASGAKYRGIANITVEKDHSKILDSFENQEEPSFGPSKGDFFQDGFNVIRGKVHDSPVLQQESVKIAKFGNESLELDKFYKNQEKGNSKKNISPNKIILKDENNQNISLYDQGELKESNGKVLADGKAIEDLREISPFKQEKANRNNIDEPNLAKNNAKNSNFKEIGHVTGSIQDHSVKPGLGNTSYAQATDTVKPHVLDQEAVELVNTIGKGIVQSIKRGENRLYLRLHPPELGRIKVDLKVDQTDNTVKAAFVTEVKDVKGLLLQHHNILKETLAHSGFHLQEFSVDVSGHESGSNAQTQWSFHDRYRGNSDGSTKGLSWKTAKSKNITEDQINRSHFISWTQGQALSIRV
ncbi:hypothetical protein DBT_0085 [Dissulfuribacter thermophilus]|uniref:Flagellar hook-length control protein-like C-terminal domain-containing protein n=1 Tax=Dissulfuribacter thermophilus TaxID=1156395 RepID=A0A1B9F8K0_9BACT|nr:flagellar hook-length control protein FliK [Dissulfuribacter thermophilus]OCC16268.1 hypothetical protein DBT_0085 [Dissulfuribacter thermophilus]